MWKNRGSNQTFAFCLALNTTLKVSLFDKMQFHSFSFYQTLTRNPMYTNEEPEEVSEGYKSGGYVAIIKSVKSCPHLGQVSIIIAIILPLTKTSLFRFSNELERLLNHNPS